MGYENSLKEIATTEELPNTIEGCHALIRNYRNAIVELSNRVSELYTEVKVLRERLNTNSSNSSLPPSKSFKKKKPRLPSKNKSGGQVGHKGHSRALLDSSEADDIVDCKLPAICECGGRISSIGEYQRHQVYELPEIKLHMTEYHLEKGYCSCCGRNHISSLPEGITWGITGPKLTGFMSHLVSKYQLSRRELKEFLKEQFQFDISLGTVFNKQKIVNTALAPLVSNLLTEVKQSPSINIDETGHKRDGKTQWLWGLVSSTAAFFSIQSSRGKKVLESLAGDFSNIVISDRCNALWWTHCLDHFYNKSRNKFKIQNLTC